LSQPVDLDAFVSSKFRIKDTYHLPDDEIEYKVEYEKDSKEKFVELHKELATVGFVPRLIGTKEETVLYVRKSPSEERRGSMIPLILTLLSAGSIVAFGLLLGTIYQQYAPSISEATVLSYYGLSVGVIVGFHEIGHRIVSRWKHEKSLASYVIPGIPGITGALPAVGVISRQKASAINRDRLFDILLAGPLLGLLVSLALYVLGAALSVQSVQPLHSCTQVSNGTATLCPSLIQSGLEDLIGPLLPSIAHGYSALSPLADGASVGLILSFVSLLPMATFDGGHLSGLVWGTGVSRAATYLCTILLISVDIPTYWALAIVALLLMNLSRSSEPQLLDEVSPIATRRRWLYVGALVLALLCMPMPHTILGYPLS